MTPRRVIQFATGNVGVHSLRALIDRPDFELVGLHASSPDKVGRTAADLAGTTTPCEVIATDDIDALVALGADCVVYTSQAETRPVEAIEELCTFLRAGTNVVGSSLIWMVAPDQADDWLRQPLGQACHEGAATLYINGVDPGFSGDTLAYTALSLSTHAESIKVSEIYDYGGYDDAEFTGVSFGFGAAPEAVPLLFAPGIIASTWGAQVRSLAADLGVELDEVLERHESWVTPEPIDCTMMHVAPGTVAAVRFAAVGVCDGSPVVTMEHVNRLTTAAAPEWPFPPDGRVGVHQVIVEGTPRIELNTHVTAAGMDPTVAGCVATAARVVNLINAVCDAPSGILAAHDIAPHQHLRGTMW